MTKRIDKKKKGMDVFVQFEAIDHAISTAGPNSETSVHWTRAVVLPGMRVNGVDYPGAPCPMNPRSHLHGVYHAVVRRGGKGFEVALRLELPDEGASDIGPTRSLDSETAAHAYAITSIGAMLGKGTIAFGSILGQEDQNWINRKIAELAGGTHRAE